MKCRDTVGMARLVLTAGRPVLTQDFSTARSGRSEGRKGENGNQLMICQTPASNEGEVRGEGVSPAVQDQ